MYICNCKGINEKSVKSAISLGASSLCELREKTSLGSCCGKCVKHAHTFLKGELSKSTHNFNNN